MGLVEARQGVMDAQEGFEQQSGSLQSRRVSVRKCGKEWSGITKLIFQKCNFNRMF